MPNLVNGHDVKWKDLTGMQLGYNLVLGSIGRRGNNWRWLCRCTLCGGERSVQSSFLRSGKAGPCRKCSFKLLGQNMAKTTPCMRCGANDFRRSKNRGRVCKPCAADIGVRRRYGISRSERDALLLAQGGRCAVSGMPIAFNRSKHIGRGGAVIDHCHGCGTIRGLLDATINTGSGLADNPDLCLAMAEYLRRHMEVCVARKQ